MVHSNFCPDTSQSEKIIAILQYDYFSILGSSLVFLHLRFFIDVFDQDLVTVNYHTQPYFS